jgi:hypothetical protein
MFDSSKVSDWTFRYDANAGNLSNIVSLAKRDLASANQVKVIWNSVTTSEYTGNSQPLWRSSNSFLGAMSLENNLAGVSGQTTGPYDSSTANPRQYINMLPVTTLEQSKNQILDEYTGYIAIGGEIIEYDAIQYQYTDLNGSAQFADIENPTDALKHLGLAQPGASNFQPNGKYRIKTRGAFGTAIQSHSVNAEDKLSSWNGYNVKWVS